MTYDEILQDPINFNANFPVGDTLRIHFWRQNPIQVYCLLEPRFVTSRFAPWLRKVDLVIRIGEVMVSALTSDDFAIPM